MLRMTATCVGLTATAFAATSTVQVEDEKCKHEHETAWLMTEGLGDCLWKYLGADNASACSISTVCPAKLGHT